MLDSCAPLMDAIYLDWDISRLGFMCSSNGCYISRSLDSCAAILVLGFHYCAIPFIYQSFFLSLELNSF
jgi:hypothetical protein